MWCGVVWRLVGKATDTTHIVEFDKYLECVADSSFAFHRNGDVAAATGLDATEVVVAEVIEKIAAEVVAAAAAAAAAAHVAISYTASDLGDA